MEKDHGTRHFMTAMPPYQAVIKNADMAEDMQQDAIDCATQALEKLLGEENAAGWWWIDGLTIRFDDCGVTDGCRVGDEWWIWWMIVMAPILVFFLTVDPLLHCFKSRWMIRLPSVK